PVPAARYIRFCSWRRLDVEAAACRLVKYAASRRIYSWSTVCRERPLWRSTICERTSRGRSTERHGGRSLQKVLADFKCQNRSEQKRYSLTGFKWYHYLVYISTMTSAK